MVEQRETFWARTFARLFGSGRSVRKEKVLAYIVHRLDKGAHLSDVVREDYVRRQASPHEVGRILDNPEIVTTARERMRRELGSEESSPRWRPRREPDRGTAPEHKTSRKRPTDGRRVLDR